MKHTPIAQRLVRPFTAVVFAVLLFGPSVVQAAECPASSPEDPQERRKLAKEWFAIAESSEAAADDAEATRGYACSYKMVAHPFTAFNLGRVAERSGENQLALKMFKAYLTLKPDATDREDVKIRVKNIEEKIAAAEAAPPTETAPEAPTEPTPEPPVEALSPPPPPPTVNRRTEPEPEAENPPSRALEWVVGGVAAATLVTGMVLNFVARSKMSSCEANAGKNPPLLGTANDECNAARPLAYTSYAMFGIAAAGVVTDALLLILRNNNSGSSASGGSDEASVGFVPLPGGGALTARGRF